MKNTTLSRLKLLAALIFSYVILFEFILPENSVAPRPSLVIESFGSLWSDYNLFLSFAFTVSAVYAGLLISLVAMTLLRNFVINLAVSYSGSAEALSIFKYISLFVFILLFSFWAGGIWISEFILVFAISMAEIMILALGAAGHLKIEYLESAESLVGRSSGKFKTVLWKGVQPFMADGIVRLHLKIWIAVLIFEFVNRSEGLGGIFAGTFQFHDLSGLFSLMLISALLIFIGELIIKFTNRKLIFWEP